MTRDTALITSATVIVLAAMICATLLTIHSTVDPVAALGVITGGIGIAGMAIGRLTGAPATDPS